ncbi:PREDICTED: kininogen-1 isoform X2 [Miniopterus natalensis]|uniref:kininogen-1 isoform X2 n=1 Tax=Miniopterus natalensis TaxID=291302 RepID=UPI0007A6B815|nr:PREDICTED: kininogen-1 isoform X2 [Miniopterus natalensis]
MKLITILFLCSKLLTSLTQEYQSQEIDCNDEDVFKAVDKALKNYNSKIQSGNQFVLYRITEVNKTVNQNIFFFVKYEIKEGNCSVESGKNWQDCDYKEPEQAATGECTANVGKRNNGKFSVATQTCHITPAKGPVMTSKYECTGCVHPISTASPDLEPVLKHAIQHFNNHTNHSHLFTLKEVKKAQRQETGECTDHAYMDPQLNIASFSQKCELLPGDDFVLPRHKCVGCPAELPVDSPRLKEPLSHAITKLNAENNATFYFKVDTVLRATSQVVAGTKFFIEFTARETTCSKGSNTELTENCETNKLGKILTCTADIYVIPWEDKVFPTVNCQSQGQTSLMKRPPGFSPFRSVLVLETKEGTTKRLKPCEYKGRPREAGAEPTSESEVA